MVLRIHAPSLWLALLMMGTSAGCGGVSYDVAPVSGRVTLDDQPLAGATVTFIPRAASDTPAGSGSYGKTDADGKYTLLIIENDQAGAAVGGHQVRISKAEGDDPTKEGGVVVDKVPEHYRGDQSILSFEVPPDGTQEANFPLLSRPMR